MAQQTNAIGQAVPLGADPVPRVDIREDVVRPIAAGANGGQGKAVDTPVLAGRDVVELSAATRAARQPGGRREPELQLSPDVLRAMVSRNR